MVFSYISCVLPSNKLNGFCPHEPLCLSNTVEHTGGAIIDSSGWSTAAPVPQGTLEATAVPSLVLCLVYALNAKPDTSRYCIHTEYLSPI